MRIGSSRVRSLQTVVLMFLLLFSGFRFPVNAQRPVIITIGQPNIWSLEQAHYLLSRMRSQNLGLLNRVPTSDDLDPNAVNGTRIELLKLLIDISAGFDSSVRRSNSLLRTDQKFNQRRRQELLTRTDELFADLDRVTGEIAVLKVERERMNSDETADDAAKKLKDTEIESAVSRQAILKERLTATTEEIKGLTSASGDLKTVKLPESGTLPDSLVDKLAKNGAKGLGDDTRLSASTILDNHIQMQYEMIAKQLTLLRDEVGPGERLVFLELPASIYTTPERADEKVAQVWWSIDGFTIVNEHERQVAELQELRDEMRRVYSEGQLTPVQWLETLSALNRRANDINRREISKRLRGLQRRGDDSIAPDTITAPSRSRLASMASSGTPSPTPSPSPTTPSTPCSEYTPPPIAILGREGEYRYTPCTLDRRQRHMVRTIDLIPRQSSLNVNEIHDTVKAGALSTFFSFLFGFGVKVDFQRQKELYEQYLHQEIFASGFGKGERVFGWTFGALPGSKRIAPGLRTSFAILAVPEDATSLQLTGRGCYFPRKTNAPQSFSATNDSVWRTEILASIKRCEDLRTFDIPIPASRENNFWLTDVDYQPVLPGHQAVVFLSGRNISAQTGVLVNGVALKPSVGIAQPTLRDQLGEEDNFEADTISGSYELVNRSQLVLVFRMPKDFKGTPLITLVSPGRGRVINDIPLWINDNPYPQTLDETSPPIFREPRDAPSLSISDLEILNVRPGTAASPALTITADLTGSSFDAANDQITVNGRPVLTHTLLADGLYRISFTLAPEDTTLNITIVQNDSVARKSFTKPFVLRISKIGVLSYEPANRRDRGVLTVHLEGAGFDESLVVSVNGTRVDPQNFTVISPTEAVLVIRAPREVSVVTLQNPATGNTTSIVVVRPRTQEKAK